MSIACLQRMSSCSQDLTYNVTLGVYSSDDEVPTTRETEFDCLNVTEKACKNDGDDDTDSFTTDSSVAPEGVSDDDTSTENFFVLEDAFDEDDDQEAETVVMIEVAAGKGKRAEDAAVEETKKSNAVEVEVEDIFSKNEETVDDPEMKGEEEHDCFRYPKEEEEESVEESENEEDIEPLEEQTVPEEENVVVSSEDKEITSEDEEEVPQTEETVTRRASFPTIQTTNVDDDDDDDDDINTYEWEKPAWIVQPGLKKTTHGQTIHKGVSLAQPVTHVNAKKAESRDKNPIANQSILQRRNTHSGITVAWQKPQWTTRNGLRSTQVGTAARQGENLALPVTRINEVREEKLGWTRPKWAGKEGSRSLRPSDFTKTSVGWEKPAWTRDAGLKHTDKGQKLIKKGNLEKPITFPRGKELRQ